MYIVFKFPIFVITRQHSTFVTTIRCYCHSVTKTAAFGTGIYGIYDQKVHLFPLVITSYDDLILPWENETILIIIYKQGHQWFQRFDSV